MYKIVELEEKEIEKFEGKIIQVIDSAIKNEDVYHYGYTYTVQKRYLTCLVEFKKKKQVNKKG